MCGEKRAFRGGLRSEDCLSGVTCLSVPITLLYRYSIHLSFLKPKCGADDFSPPAGRSLCNHNHLDVGHDLIDLIDCRTLTDPPGIQPWSHGRATPRQRPLSSPSPRNMAVLRRQSIRRVMTMKLSTPTSWDIPRSGSFPPMPPTGGASSCCVEIISS